jgi:hypothetical protein
MLRTSSLLIMRLDIRNLWPLDEFLRKIVICVIAEARKRARNTAVIGMSGIFVATPPIDHVIGGYGGLDGNPVGSPLVGPPGASALPPWEMLACCSTFASQQKQGGENSSETIDEIDRIGVQVNEVMAQRTVFRS